MAMLKKCIIRCHITPRRTLRDLWVTLGTMLNFCIWLLWDLSGDSVMKG